MKKYAEIAAELGISEAAVKLRASKALRKIKRAGNMDAFVALVCFTESKAVRYLPRCGSVECLPEWREIYGEQMKTVDF